MYSTKTTHTLGTDKFWEASLLRRSKWLEMTNLGLNYGGLINREMSSWQRCPLGPTVLVLVWHSYDVQKGLMSIWKRHIIHVPGTTKWHGHTNHIASSWRERDSNQITNVNYHFTESLEMLQELAVLYIYILIAFPCYYLDKGSTHQ
jgi:hypothetical protein